MRQLIQRWAIPSYPIQIILLVLKYGPIPASFGGYSLLSFLQRGLQPTVDNHRHFRTMLMRYVFASGVNSATGGSPVYIISY